MQMGENTRLIIKINECVPAAVLAKEAVRFKGGVPLESIQKIIIPVHPDARDFGVLRERTFKNGFVLTKNFRYDHRVDVVAMFHGEVCARIKIIRSREFPFGMFSGKLDQNVWKSGSPNSEFFRGAVSAMFLH